MKKIATAILAGALAFSSVSASAAIVPPRGGHAHGGGGAEWAPWVVIGCATGVVSAAMAKNWRRNKELTGQEAWTCGLQYWWNEATGRYGR